MTLLFPRRRLLSTALVFVLATARPAPLVADEFRAARGLISSAIAEGKTPSVALAVSKGGRILYADGFGWSDREAQVKATADTVYGLGSVSKPIIATAIMILNAEHRLRIDHPVNEYLGTARLSTRLSIVQSPTVQHLLQHTSGLGPYYQTYFADEPEVPPEMDVVIRRYGQIFWRPGEGFQYSNLNYGVLGRVIEVRSGSSLRAFLRNKLFLPLTMKHTSIGIDPNVSQFRAARYGRGGKRLPDYQASPAAAADIWSSALDLVRFGQLYCPSEGVDRATSLMPSSSIQSMLTTLIPMGRQYYGLGWVISRDALGRTRVRHGGAGAGVGAELTILPSEELVIAVLVNADTSMPSEPKILPTRIADAILDQILLAQRQPSAPEQPPKSRRITISAYS